MKKNIMYDVLLRKKFPYGAKITFGDFINEMEYFDGDEIHIFDDEGHQSENNACDAYTVLIIQRPRFETNEEFEKRKKLMQQNLERERQMRYNRYLELKKEFEE